MKFHCEYCREEIDADKDRKCPNCGATYKNNKEYQKKLEEKNEQQKEFKRQVKKIWKIASVLFIVAPVIFIGVFALIIAMAVKTSKNTNDDFDEFKNKVEDKINNATEKTEEKEVEPVLVNQEKSSSDYKVKLEKYRLIEEKNDKEYDKLEITIVVEKISDKFSAWGEEIYCLVNNVSQKSDNFNSDISTYIKDKGIPETKKRTYYIPKNTTSFDVKYGQNIEFHVDVKSD